MSEETRTADYGESWLEVAAAVEYLDAAHRPGFTVWDALAEAFAHLMQAACGRASFYGGAPIRTVPVSGCSGFARERHIARIAELPVGSAGAAIHDAVAARCAANGEVSIEEVDGSREAIPCTRPLQRRPPWYEVRALIVP